MKKVYYIILLFALSVTNLIAQSNSFEQGYFDGYCQAFKDSKSINQNSPCPILATYPLPEPMKKSYQDGFARGMKDFNSGKNSIGTSGPNQSLIDGQKKLGESNGFVDYSKAIPSSTGDAPPIYKMTLKANFNVLKKDLKKDSYRIEYLVCDDLWGFWNFLSIKSLKKIGKKKGFVIVRTKNPSAINKSKTSLLTSENTLYLSWERKAVMGEQMGVNNMTGGKIYERNIFDHLDIVDSNGNTIMEVEFTNYAVEGIIDSLRPLQNLDVD
jgi:hypothetical protein